MIHLDTEKRYEDEVGRGFNRLKLAYAIAEPDEPDDNDQTAMIVRNAKYTNN